MGKFIGLLLTMVCIWAGLEIYNEGLHGAFGGALASLEDGEQTGGPTDTRTAPQRAGANRIYTHRDRGRLLIILRGKRRGDVEALAQETNWAGAAFRI